MQFKSLFIGLVACASSIFSFAEVPNKHHFPLPTEMMYQKPGADVQIMNPSIQKITLSEEKSFELKLRSAKKSGLLDVTIKMGNGLNTLDNDGEYSFDLSDSNTVNIPMNLSVDDEGQYFMHVFVKHTDEMGRSSTRASAIVFRTPGAVELAKAKQAKTAAREFVVLPARERIY